MSRIAVIAYSPAPYRIELFDEITRRARVRLDALYIHRNEPGRHWAAPTLAHPACFIHEPGQMSVATRTIQEADLVVISYFADAAASALWKVRRRSGRPWTFWGERPGSHHRHWAGRLLRRFRLRHLRASDATIWAIGSWAVQAYRDELGSRLRVENLPYFSDLARFTAASQNKRAGKERRILFSGSLIKRKGVDLLLNAYANVSRRRPQLHLTFDGKGDLHDQIKKQIEAEKIKNCSIQCSAWSELPALYAAHDLLAVPSRYDGWGMVVPEGLASGLPVIATDQMGAAHDLITPSRNGWVVRADDEASLTERLDAAVSLDDQAHDAMSSAARASVATHQLRDGAERFEQLCKSTLSHAA